MEGLKLVPGIVLILMVSGIMLGAGVISESKMGDTITKCINSSFSYNSTANQCQARNASGGYVTMTTSGYGNNFTHEYHSIDQSQDGLLTVSEQQSTLAIIAVMVIIITALAGVFVYFKFFR